MTHPVHIVARIVALPDQVEALKAVLIELVEATRQEAGSIKYELLQNQSDLTEFTILEEWATDEALKAHQASAHFKAAVTKLQGLLAAPLDVRHYALLA
jgi:quinol monooxygenase YgiN